MKKNKKEDNQKSVSSSQSTVDSEKNLSQESLNNNETKEVVLETNMDYKDMALRAQADYKNLQSEIAKQRSQWASMSEWQILEEFIPVYDNFKKATAHKPESDDKSWKSWSEGVVFIMKQFADILKNHGITEVKTVGEKFDAERHESVDEQDSDENTGTILKEVDSGYEKSGKVLKVAKVVVAK